MRNRKKSKKNYPKSVAIKREWGTEKSYQPLPNIHFNPTSTKIAFSRFAIVLTVFFWLLYVVSVVFKQFFSAQDTYTLTTHAFSYVLIVTFLTGSSLIYLITRQGAFQRFSKHVRLPRYLIDKYFSETQPTVTVLIPSYSEEPQIIKKTILSAALQEYPEIRIVLLIDDDESKLKGEKLEKLKLTQKLGDDIEKLLSEPKQYYQDQYMEFIKENTSKKDISGKQLLRISQDYDYAATWLNKLADKEEIEDHIDIFFTDQVLRKLAKDLLEVSKALKTSHKEKASISQERVEQLYKRLIWTFSAKIDNFERKKYLSLSHEPNKAMNINSYIGLMGGKYAKVNTREGVVLLPVEKTNKSDLEIPDSDYILTLDADSMLLQEYCLRLVYFLEQSENSDVAIAQTPYSSYRGARTRIERMAAATTDIQHILHQGMTYYGATFWVGANAIIRKKALEDIEEKELVGGFEIKRYVQDHTVIEDTESSIDLAMHGWKIINYPERLSYSATPPDFGSLIVQRRRWANGGLLIAPKLWTQKNNPRRLNMSKMEILIRLNYMASIAWSNVGLIFLLAFPYDGRLLSPLIVLAALPYFAAMAGDLKYCGYNYRDVFSIYGFNLILLPVNIAGVFKSLSQALTTKKIPFSRTPKIKNRTIAQPIYILSPIFILLFSVITLVYNFQRGNYGNAAFAAFNSITITWAMVYFIGLKNMIMDLWIGLRNWLFVEAEPAGQDALKPSQVHEDWQAVLYHGNSNDNKKYIPIAKLLVESKKDKI